MSIRRFIRSDLISLGGYSAHKPPETITGAVENIIKLDANENPYGFSPLVSKALAGHRRFNIYPDSAQTRLRRNLQEYAGVDAGSLVAANGSGELLDYILCLLLEPGDEVINSLPTFDLYRLRTLINRGRLVNVSRKPDFSLDIAAIKGAISPRTKLIIVANPNNPTGNVIPRDELMELVETGIPLLVDEAYYEFCGETVAPLVKEHPNLMVLRTFSKWAGVAGLRVGYGIFSPVIVGYLLKIKMPYNVSAAAELAVAESLKDRDALMGKVKQIIAERERLYSELGRVKYLKPFPSRANFIFCSVLGKNAVELHRELEGRGILVRYFDQPLVRNGFRISVGRPADSDRLIETLQAI